jgi:hypothetical protein
MFNVHALTASHRTDRMSAIPIRILGKATFAICTMRADDVTRKSVKVNAGTRVGRAIRDAEYSGWLKVKETDLEKNAVQLRFLWNM